MPLHEIAPIYRASGGPRARDPGFYDHGALNLSSMLRALAANIRAKAFVQGGSTITQQLVKLTLGTPLSSIGREFQEVALAMRVEQKYSKNRT